MSSKNEQPIASANRPLPQINSQSNDLQKKEMQSQQQPKVDFNKRLIEVNDDDDEDCDDEFDESNRDDFTQKANSQNNKVTSGQLTDMPGQLNKVQQSQSIKNLKQPEKDPLQMMSMPLPLVAGQHSLQSDMQFGWKPQADKEVPPIPFCFGLVQYNLELFNYPKVLYVGPRFTNSYQMHEQYANKLMKLPIQNEDGQNMQAFAYHFTFPKFYDSKTSKYEEAFSAFVDSLEYDSSISDQNLNFRIPNPNAKRDVSNSLLSVVSSKDEREDFYFDSNFESGNLDFVGKVSNNEYDLLMRLDSNSRSHQQWYYFSIDCKDIKRRSTKGETIKLNILNFTKPNTLYSQGMRPVAWSKMKCAKEGAGWHRVGQNITYKVSKLCRQNQLSGYTRTWYQMSFEYTFESDQDKIWFAYAIPYSFTMLTNFIKAIEDIQKQPENVKNNQIFKKEILGKSLSGVEIPILTITDFSETKKRKKTIVMVGRLHPGETHSSWLIHGFIRFLLSESPKAKDLRNKVIFKIVPMLNPDGVIVGNYRCTLAGCDMNRNFGGGSDVTQRLNPETLLFKTMAKQQDRLALFFDVHSHSSKKSIFIYGPYFPLHSEHYLKIRVMPRLLAEKSQMFRYYSCRFRNELNKQHCSRLTIFRDCNLPQCYTIETSIMGFLSQERQNVSFGIPSLQYFGEKFGETLLDWFLILENHQKEKIKRAIMMSRQRKSRKRSIIDIIGEEDYLEFKEDIDRQLHALQREDDLLEAAESSSKKQSKLKKGGSLRRKSLKGMSRRKTLVETTQQFTGVTAAQDTTSIVDQTAINLHNFSESVTGPVTQQQIDSLLNKDERSIYQHSKSAKKSSRLMFGQDNFSDDAEDDDEFDEGNHNQNVNSQAMKPKLHQQKQNISFVIEEEPQEQTNRGFFVPKLAGFQYLEGSEFQQQTAKQIKIQQKKEEITIDGNHIRTTVNNQASYDDQDDDEKFIQQDQAAQVADQPLRRLEDIEREIKKDLSKAMPNNAHGMNIDIENQLYDEKDLDSQRSATHGKEKDIDDDYEDQMLKMQECLVSYFENVEELQSKPKQSLIRKHPIEVVIKEKVKPIAPPEIVPPMVMQQQPLKMAPIKIPQRIPSQILMPYRKEVVFQVKKPAIQTFPPEKPKSVMMGLRQHIYPPQQTYMHYNHRAQNNMSPKNDSFTIMNRTNEEFFDLLQKYVHTKNPRATSAISNKQNPGSIFNQPQKKPILNQNQSLLHHMQHSNFQQQQSNNQPHSTDSQDNQRKHQQINTSRNLGGQGFQQNSKVNSVAVQQNYQAMRTQALEGNVINQGNLVENRPISMLNCMKGTSMMDTPHKKRLSDDTKLLVKGVNSTGKKSGSHKQSRLGNFLLMVDGRGVSSTFNSEKKPKSIAKPKEATNLGQQLYDNIQAAKLNQIHNKMMVGQHSKSFLGLTEEKRDKQLPYQNKAVDRRQSTNISLQASIIPNSDQDYKQSPHHISHTRHSSYTQQMNQQISNDQYQNRNNQFSPIPFLITQEGDSPLKQQRQIDIISQHITSNKIPGVVLATKKRKVEFLRSKTDDISEIDFEVCSNMKQKETDSSKFYHQHLNNYIDDSSTTGLRLSQDPSGSNLHNRHRKVKSRAAGGSCLNLSSADITEDEIITKGIVIKLPDESSQPGNYYIQKKQHHGSQKHDAFITSGGGGISPMKNQLLLDMFRETTLQGQQARRGNSTIADKSKYSYQQQFNGRLVLNGQTTDAKIKDESSETIETIGTPFVSHNATS